MAERPSIAASAHQRVHDMVKAAGATDGLHVGETSCPFFAGDLFGLDVPLGRVVRYFETVAQSGAQARPHGARDRLNGTPARSGSTRVGCGGRSSSRAGPRGQGPASPANKE